MLCTKKKNEFSVNTTITNFTERNFLWNIYQPSVSVNHSSNNVNTYQVHDVHTKPKNK